MRYSKLERNLAVFLSKFPKTKQKLKKFYQYANYLIYKKNYNFKTLFPIFKISMEEKESFFGYYDKSPINEENRYIIFHSSNIPTSMLPDPNIPVDIVLYDLEKGEYKVIDRSLSYNWQQGSRLMWISKDKFIYNIFENGDYKSKIFNVKENSFNVIDFPVYDCYKDKFALSLNFERLKIGRGDYAYFNKNKVDWDDLENDGLYFIDLEKNSFKLILNFKDLINLKFKETMKNTKHKINHIMISPSGKKAMFIHRWFEKSGRRFDRLIVIDLNKLRFRYIC